MRGTSLPQCIFHPTDHVQQDIHPTDNPPQSARKSGWERHDVESDDDGAAPELRPTKSACAGDVVLRTSTRGTVPMGQCDSPAPGAPFPLDSAMGVIEDSISQCTHFYK
jgi:hypothetical protein